MEPTWLALGARERPQRHRKSLLSRPRLSNVSLPFSTCKGSTRLTRTVIPRCCYALHHCQNSTHARGARVTPCGTRRATASRPWRTGCRRSSRRASWPTHPRRLLRRRALPPPRPPPSPPSPPKVRCRRRLLASGSRQRVLLWLYPQRAPSIDAREGVHPLCLACISRRVYRG